MEFSIHPIFEFNDNNFLFTIYDQSTDKHYPEFDRMFTLYYEYYDYKGNGTIIKSRKNPFEKCGNETKAKHEKIFRYNPNCYYCFPEKIVIPLKGFSSLGIFNTIRIQVDYCYNNTNPDAGPI